MFRLLRIALVAIALVPPTVIRATRSTRVVDPQERLRRFSDVGAARRFRTIETLIELGPAYPLIGEQRWALLVADHRSAIEQSKNHTEFALAVNAMLQSTNMSHLRYYESDEWEYWIYRSGFSADQEAEAVEHTGIVPQKVGSRWFVRGVLEGSTAASADIRVGDELVSVDGIPFTPITSWRGKDAHETAIVLRRRPGSLHTVRIRVVKESLWKAFERATENSVRVITHDKVRIGYLHAWILSEHGTEYEKLAALKRQFDAVVLDFRDGFGGLPESALSFLLGKQHKLVNGAETSHYEWANRLVILTGSGTRSAKEIVTARARATVGAVLVGSPTAGAVQWAGCQLVGADGLLLAPVTAGDPALEGKPTQPDVWAERVLCYSAGEDGALVKAVEVVSSLAGAPTSGNTVDGREQPSEPRQ